MSSSANADGQGRDHEITNPGIFLSLFFRFFCLQRADNAGFSVTCEAGQVIDIDFLAWTFSCVDASDANSCPADMGGYRIGCTAPPAQQFDCGCDNEILITNDCRLVYTP